MPKSNWMPLVAVGLASALAARCTGEASPDRADAGTADAGGSDAGVVPPIAHCETDLSTWTGDGTGSGALARVAANADLLKGEAATGRAGDVLLANDRVRVIIEQPGRSIGAQPYGGNLIDADLVRADGTSRDAFGELGALFQFGRTVDAERVEILRDGSTGGAAVVAATGRDAVLDFINLRGLGSLLPGLTIPDSDKELSLRITTYYVLRPGSSAVHVVQAFCNEADAPVTFGTGDLIDSGGEVEPLQGRSGFPAPAAGPGGLGGLGASPGEPFVGWLGRDVAYGIFPAQDKNQVLTVAGVTATLYGANSLLDFTRGPSAPKPEGAVTIAAKGTLVVPRDFVVAADPGGLFTHLRTLRGTPSGTLSGLVRSSAGAPVAGARVVASSAGALASIFTTDADGRYSGLVPVGVVDVAVDDGIGRASLPNVTVSAGATATADLTLPPIATLVVSVKDDAGIALPAKITVICDPTCPFPRNDAEARRFRDAADALPTTAIGETFAQVYLDPTGLASLAVPPTKLRVFVSRGPEWSLHEATVEPAAGASVAVDATLAHVVDTTGWMSGDFHVHAINSPDSPVPNVERLRTFLAEGVDVIVSTDHDFITDFTPFLAQIPRGDAFLKPITGVELTTFDYGHYNAFPLVADASRNGGAVDWAGGRGPGLPPGAIFERLHAFAGDQVVQVNHARSGLFSATGLDTRTLWTRTNAARFRIGGVETDTDTGDSRLYDDRYTALEIQNGNGDTFFELVNDWMSILSRGSRKTGTAVSDTHRRHGDSGSPRTWVRTSTDDPKTLDTQAFARSVNEGRAIGSNGPFVLLTVAKAGGQPVSVGDTLVSAGEPVTITVEVRTPAWMEANEVKLFINATGTETVGGRAPRTLPEAAATLPITLAPRGTGLATSLVGTVTHTFTPAKDAWIIAVVTGTKDLFPVVGKGGVMPRAFTNPVFIDTAGDGWTPPVDLAAVRAAVGTIDGTSEQPLTAPVTEERLREVLGADLCHPGEDR